jgi:hypothetical protein
MSAEEETNLSDQERLRRRRLQRFMWTTLRKINDVVSIIYTYTEFVESNWG